MLLGVWTHYIVELLRPVHKLIISNQLLNFWVILFSTDLLPTLFENILEEQNAEQGMTLQVQKKKLVQDVKLLPLNWIIAVLLTIFSKILVAF